MSPAVDITGDSIENNAIIINEEDDFLAVTHKASGTRLLVDRNTDLSDLWDAFDQGIETSEFWQDDGSGIAELLSQYNGINTPSVKTDSINSDGDLNIQSNSDLNQNDIKNAGSVEADSASIERLNTTPTGVVVSLDGDQEIADDTRTAVNWGDEETRGDVGDMLEDNAVVIPSGFGYAKITVGLRWFNQVPLEFFDLQLNNRELEYSFGSTSEDGRFESAYWGPRSTAWVPVSEGDEIRTRITQTSGGTEDLRDIRETWMEVWLI